MKARVDLFAYEFALLWFSHEIGYSFCAILPLFRFLFRFPQKHESLILNVKNKIIQRLFCNKISLCTTIVH